MTPRSQHPAIDHVRKFLTDCCVIGDGHAPIFAMCKAYTLWCEVNGVKNRRLDPVPFLACLELDHGIVAGKCHWTEDGEPRSAYALKGVRFKDERLRALRKDRERDDVGDTIDAHIALSGRARDEPKKNNGDETRLTDQQRARRAYYLKNKDRIKARKKVRR